MAIVYTRTTAASPSNLVDDPEKAPAIRGSYNVRIEANGKDNAGDAFTRIKKGSFQVFEVRIEGHELPDADQDGMPARYERLHSCLDPNKFDADDDGDEDGIVNVKEWDLGTDPCHPDSDRGGETDTSEFGRDANVFDPQDDTLATPIDPEVIDYVLDHLPKPDLRPESNLIRYPVHASYAKMRLYRSLTASGPFTTAVEFDAKSNAGLFRDEGLQNGVTYYYKIAGLDVNGNAGTPSHVFSGTPSEEPFPPIGNVEIQNGRPYVKSTNVSLNFRVEEDVVEMQLANSLALLDGAAWETFVPTRTWTLSPSGTTGYAQAYARFRDKAGNVSIVYQDDVIVRKPNTFGSILGVLKLKLLSPKLERAAHDGHDHPQADSGLLGVMIASPDHPEVPPAFADANGAFALDELPPGDYTIEIRLPGFATRRIENVSVGVDGQADLGEIELQQQAQLKLFLPVTARN